MNFVKSKKNKTKYSRNLKTGYAGYKNMMHEFRPFVMFTNAHDHSSKIVNTDRLGFRKVFFKKKNLGLDDLKKSSNKINILLGGSTAFGSGCPSDKNTISLSYRRLANYVSLRYARRLQPSRAYSFS